MSDDYEAQAAEYIRQSGKSIHASDCATSNAPAMQPGLCDCDEVKVTQAVERIEKYLNELTKMRYLDQAIIHSFHVGDDERETSLNVADIKDLIEIASHAAQARLEGAKMGLEVVSELLNDAAQSDCEHGVRWLNEKAASSYLHEYRHTAQALQAIRALDPQSIIKGEA